METHPIGVAGTFRNSTLLALLCVFAVLAVLDTVLAKSAIIVPFNKAVWEPIRGLRAEMPWLKIPMIAVTLLASDPGLCIFVIALAIGYIRHRRRSDAVWLILIIIIGQITVVLAKALVRLDRPLLVPPPLPFYTFSGYSFPSGHALMSTVVLGSAALIAVRHAKTKAGRNVTILGCVFLVLVVGLSRIYLGAHWANDVVGGYLYGICILISVHLLRKKFRPRVGA